MKEYDQVIFVDQLKHQRDVAGQIEKTRLKWQKQSSWFAVAQRGHYSQYATIYAECLKKYGDKKFGFYAKRNRLSLKFACNEKEPNAMNQNDQKSDLKSMDHLKRYKFPKTTNGEYGSVPPSRLYFCF
ncbi:uncharacterized protein LOC108094346 [Drosophila ficusphila]|uniref:uncharacterized protein LOC108094346 n=1 Tax=Drosophila ficusphila TaxID=30025 RepID=UPI0007E638A1|nr:uncharacterized protein LOC108094346 [Drosophila ficusphila]